VGYNPSYKWINPTKIPFISGVITHLRFVGSSPPSRILNVFGLGKEPGQENEGKLKNFHSLEAINSGGFRDFTITPGYNITYVGLLMAR